MLLRVVIDEMGADGMLNKEQDCNICFLILKPLILHFNTAKDLKWAVLASRIWKHKQLWQWMKEENSNQNIAQRSAWFIKHCEFFWKAGNNFISLGKLKRLKRSLMLWNEIKQEKFVEEALLWFFFLQYNKYYLWENKGSFYILHPNEIPWKCICVCYYW